MDASLLHELPGRPGRRKAHRPRRTAHSRKSRTDFPRDDARREDRTCEVADTTTEHGTCPRADSSSAGHFKRCDSSAVFFPVILRTKHNSPPVQRPPWQPSSPVIRFRTLQTGQKTIFVKTGRSHPCRQSTFLCRLLFFCMARSKTFPGLKNREKKPSPCTTSLMPPCFLLLLSIPAWSHPKSVLSRRIEQPHFFGYHIGEFPKIPVKNNLLHFIIKYTKKVYIFNMLYYFFLNEIFPFVHSQKLTVKSITKYTFTVSSKVCFLPSGSPENTLCLHV